MQLEPSLSLRRETKGGIPFLAYAGTREVALSQCAVDAKHLGHMLGSCCPSCQSEVAEAREASTQIELLERLDRKSVV